MAKEVSAGGVSVLVFGSVILGAVLGMSLKQCHTKFMKWFVYFFGMIISTSLLYSAFELTNTTIKLPFAIGLVIFTILEWIDNWMNPEETESNCDTASKSRSFAKTTQSAKTQSEKS